MYPDFTTINTISIPMDAMYLHARTLYTIADTTFIPMGVMYLHARTFIGLLFPWVQKISACKKVFYTHWYHFYSHVCDVFTCKNVPYTGSYIFCSLGYNVRAWNLFGASVAKLVLWQLMILLPCKAIKFYFIANSGNSYRDRHSPFQNF